MEISLLFKMLISLFRTQESFLLKQSSMQTCLPQLNHKVSEMLDQMFKVLIG